VEGTDSTEEDDGGSKNISPSSSMNPLANWELDDDGKVDVVDEVGRPLVETDAVVGLIWNNAASLEERPNVPSSVGTAAASFLLVIMEEGCNDDDDSVRWTPPPRHSPWHAPK
jgi:hypothetical protein